MASPTDRPRHGDDPIVPVAPARSAHRTEEVPQEHQAESFSGRSPEEEEHRGPLSFLKELPGLIIIALVLALLIKSFLVQAFFIPSESMVPTLRDGDRVLVNKLILTIRDPRRGEIVVFENPRLQEEDRNPFSAAWHWVTEGLGFSVDPNKDFIKRVIGVPGDTVEVRGGRVFVNGARLQEPYLQRNSDRSDYGPYTVPPDTYFMMGDNRANSQDSRSQAVGPVPREKIVGKAFVILWPPPRFEWLGAGD